MNKFLLTSVVVILTTSFSIFNVCQAQTAPAPYGEVNFIDVKPNMNESYLIDVKTSKKLHNARKANKTIISWQLYRRTYPRGSNMEYDYVGFTVYPSGKEMKAEGTWDSGVKELSAKEIEGFLTSLNNNRSIVATDLYHYKMGTTPSISLPGEYVQLNLVKIKPGMYDAYVKNLETWKLVLEECIKAGKLKGFNVWDRTYQTNVMGNNDFTVTFSFATFDQALSWASGKINGADEFKKLFPKEDYNAFTAKLRELREINNQELWELVEVTD